MICLVESTWQACKDGPVPLTAKYQTTAREFPLNCSLTFGSAVKPVTGAPWSKALPAMGSLNIATCTHRRLG